VNAEPDLGHIILPPDQFWEELRHAGTLRLTQTTARRQGVIYHCPRFTLQVEWGFLCEQSAQSVQDFVAELEERERFRRRMRILASVAGIAACALVMWLYQ